MNVNYQEWEIVQWFFNQTAFWQATIAGTVTWGFTALGASLVFFVKTLQRKVLDVMLGFTGGVMLAAAFFSLLKPAAEMATKLNVPAFLPLAVGFLSGTFFLFGMDKVLPHLHINHPVSEKEGVNVDWNKSILLVLAITLHNIPEGLAIGMAFGAVAAGVPHAEIGTAVALAIGISIQNLPEGLAVAMPLRRQGISRRKSFFYGHLSAMVEPVAAAIGALMVFQFQQILPYALAFAAGAMIYVVVEEVIPETQREKNTDLATIGLLIGFALMMSLDLSLG
jgi:ZIP family zinc transporter